LSTGKGPCDLEDPVVDPRAQPEPLNGFSLEVFPFGIEFAILLHVLWLHERVRVDAFVCKARQLDVPHGQDPFSNGRRW